MRLIKKIKNITRIGNMLMSRIWNSLIPAGLPTGSDSTGGKNVGVGEATRTAVWVGTSVAGGPVVTLLSSVVSTSLLAPWI